MYNDDKAEYPHSFSVLIQVTKNTGIISKDGHEIHSMPEPIGFVAPAHHHKYVVKPKK